MSIDRQYVTLFQWVRGCDIQRLVDQGRLDARESVQLVEMAIQDLACKGFRVLDMKPNHLIVRQCADGRLLKRRGRTAYVLVDFELLRRTNEYERWRRRDSRLQMDNEPISVDSRSEALKC